MNESSDHPMDTSQLNESALELLGNTDQAYLALLQEEERIMQRLEQRLKDTQAEHDQSKAVNEDLEMAAALIGLKDPLEEERVLQEENGWKTRRYVEAMIPPDAGSCPIQKLPDEILMQILALFQGWNQIVIGYWGFNRIPSNTLTWICSRWRGIAIDTPELWSKISVQSSSGLDDDQYDTLLQEMFKTILKRSKDHPLDIHIHLESATHPVVSQLWETCLRWRSLAMDFYDYPESMSLDASLIFRPVIYLPSLEQVWLGAYERQDLEIVLSAAPNLKRAYILMQDSSNTWNYTYSYPNIAGLYLDTNFENWHQVSLMPNVKVLIVNAEKGTAKHSIAPVLLPPSCRTLIVTGIDTQENLSFTLDSIRAPHIEYLNLRSFKYRHQNGNYPRVPIHSLESFVNNSRCRLTTLWFDDMTLPTEELPQLLSAINIPHPQLRHVQVGSNYTRLRIRQGSSPRLLDPGVVTPMTDMM
jgi:hypothetical protein